MSNDQSPYDDEIDLLSLLLILWDGRWKIIGSTFVMALAGFLYITYQPALYQITTPVQKANQSVFLPYNSLNYLLNENSNNLEGPINVEIDSSSIFEMFIDEFNGYKAAIATLSEDEFIMKSMEGLDEISKQRELINYARSFKLTQMTSELSKSRGTKDYWLLSNTSADKSVSLRLFNKIIQQTLINVQKKAISNINKVIGLAEDIRLIKLEKLRNNLYLIKLNYLKEIKKHMKYLSEQAAIAKDLGIQSHSFDENNLAKLQFSLNVNVSDFPYYLRGTKAINQEIAVMQNRSEEDLLLFSDEYNAVKKEIFSIENNLLLSQLRAAADLVATDNANNWINFNFNFVDSKSLSLKKNWLIFFFSIVLGGMMGVIYVFFSNATRMRRNKVVKT